MRRLLICIIFVLSLNYVYCQTFINEINFIDDEYIEIYSNNFLNLTNHFLYDNYGYVKSNFLEVVSIKNSSYYLIVGEDFLENNNYSSLNCTIYSTKKSGIGYYNLIDSSENISIEINSSLNITWIKDKNYEFLNQSLSYNFSNFSYYKSNKSPCKQNFQEHFFDENKTILENLSHINDTILCDINFSIVPQKRVFENRIEYKFETDVSDFYIEYWIEDYAQDIVKTKRNTTNLNTKYYTPEDKINIYYLKANLFYGECIINKSELIMFYSPTIPSINEENSCEILDSNINELNSYIKILNKEVIKNQEKDVLYYEIYRGDTSKRSIYFYLNNKEISSFELAKYTKISGRLKLNLENDNSYNLSIFGLDLKQDISINNSSKAKIVLISKNNKFEIKDFIINNSIIKYEIGNNLDENFTSQCYITYIKTKVSNILNITINQTKYSQNINVSKLFAKEKMQDYELKLTCRYKDKSKSYYTYESKEFILSIKNKINYDILASNSSSILSKNDNFSLIKEIKIQKNSSGEVLSGNIIKKNDSNIFSFYLILVALVLIIIIFVVKR